MRKLKTYLEKWFNGQSVRGIQVSLVDIRECAQVYDSILSGSKPEFINSKVKEVLDKCHISTVEYGIGWKVV